MSTIRRPPHSTRRSPAVRVAEQGPLVLASGSPRRRELLASLGLAFTIDAADIDERELDDEDPCGYVVRLARTKAQHVAARNAPGSVVIGADTTVELDGVILGKPSDAADAAEMLGRLSGRTHRVHTGMAVAVAGRDQAVWALVTTTEVTFRVLDHSWISWYVSTGEPMDKAGAYAIQGIGGAFVARVEGNVQNVVGLPLAELLTNPQVEALARSGRVTPVI